MKRSRGTAPSIPNLGTG